VVNTFNGRLDHLLGCVILDGEVRDQRELSCVGPTADLLTELLHVLMGSAESVLSVFK
jgi:hypothetical protein